MPTVARGRLDGAGILITRPARQAAGFAQQIAAIGGMPLVFPAIVILPPGDRRALDVAQHRLASYDFAVFVSANAVEYGVGDRQAWPGQLRVFAPGPGTAAALAAAGILDVRVPATTMDSEGLLALPELAAVSGKRVLILRGSGGRQLLGSTLTARGASVDYVECYTRAKPVAGAAGLEEALRERRVDATTLTSSEGLDNLWEVLGADARARFAATPAFVPHPRIAERARAIGIATVIVTEPADSGLIATLLEYFAAVR
ncbi:MAG: uroporphyrinogen-III synthase [Casimicrobiaceae bacterium]